MPEAIAGQGCPKSRLAKYLGTTVSGVVLCLGLMAISEGALAQGAGVKATEAISFNIPAQNLNNAILKLANRAGVQIFYDVAHVDRLRSSSVVGKVTPQQAMSQMLKGTGIGYRFKSKGVVSLIIPSSESEKLNSDGTIVLKKIVVHGESAYGPVDGYIAQNSATVSKTDTPITELPRSVSVVSADQVKAQGAKSVVQALRYSAGVAAEVRGSATRYDIPYVRGFGAPGESILFVNGLPLLHAPGYASPQMDIANIERVELLKGPSSTLYGASQAGGMVNSITKRPTRTPQNEVTVTYGSNDNKETTFDFSGPTGGSDTLSHRLVGHLKNSNTQVEFTKEERLFLAPSLNWHPSVDTELNVSLNYTYDPEGGYYGVLPTVGTLLENPGNPMIPKDFFDGDPNHDLFKRRQTILSADFSHRLSDAWTFRAGGNLIDLSVDTASVLARGLTGTNILRYAFDTQEELTGGVIDANFLGEFSTEAVSHKVLFGLNYQSTNWDYQAQFGGAPSIDYTNPDYTLVTPAPNPFIDQLQQLDQTGFYLQDQMKVGRFSFSAGVRYDRATNNLLNRLTGITSIVEDEALSGKVGAVYSFDNGFSAYGSWSTSFLPVTGTDTNTGFAFEPLTSRQIEVGIKYQPESFPGLFTISAYDIVQDNTITRNAFNQSFQNGNTRSRGLEFEAKFQPIQELNVIAALGVVDAELTEGVGFGVGDSPIGTPDKTASLWMDYTFSRGSLSGLMIGAGVRYVGSSTGGYLTDGTRINVPGYSLVDMTFKYDLSEVNSNWGGTSLKLNVSNLFDETYVTCLSNNFCNYGNERTATLTLTKAW